MKFIGICISFVLFLCTCTENRNSSQFPFDAKHRIELIYAIVICCILLFAIHYFIYRKKLKQRNHKIVIMQKMYYDCALQLNLAQQELAKNHDLNEKAITAIVKEKEETIQMLQAEIKKYEVLSIGHNLLELDNQIKQSSIYKKLIYLENHPLEKMTKGDWANLEATVEKLVLSFASLKQKLNTKEYHICLLVKLHFPHLQQVALSELPCQTYRTIDKKCY